MLGSANVTAIPVGAISSDRENYPLISITPILFKVYEKKVSHSSLVFARNMFFCLLISLFIGIDWDALMHCLPYLIAFRSP